MAYTTHGRATKEIRGEPSAPRSVEEWRAAVLFNRKEYERMLAEIGHPAARPSAPTKAAGPTPAQVEALKGLAELDAALKAQGHSYGARMRNLAPLVDALAAKHFGGAAHIVIGVVMEFTDAHR
jgi:hypothetical protein